MILFLAAHEVRATTDPHATASAARIVTGLDTS
jgi:hypothetical protein